MNIDFKFFGRNLENNSNKSIDFINEESVKAYINNGKLFLTKQVHGNNVFFLQDFNDLKKNNCIIESDAIITNLQNISIGVLTADCVPILIYAKETIGAIHAGWKGLYDGIIENTIKKMIETENNLGPAEITAIIGPHILVNSYEVDQRFFDHWLEKDPKNEQYFCFKNNAKYNFDLQECAMQVLRTLGLVNITKTKIDTFTNSDYYSYRKSNAGHGRNLSVIVKFFSTI